MTQLTRAAAIAVASLLTITPLTTTAATAATPATSAGTTVEDSTEDAQLLLLMDASGSMADPDALGEPKIDAARTALAAVIDELHPEQRVGLRVFGGAVPLDQPTEAKCSDSQLVVPIDADNANELNTAIDSYQPMGETPIGYALQQAADDLGPDGHRTVLLVSDGIATCDPDPCQVAEQLTADGLDLVVHTVGLGADDATRSQLQCIADAAGGTYYDTEETDTLTTALTRISTRAFRPFAIQGTPVEGTPSASDAPELTTGQYTDTLVGNDETKHYLLRRTLPGSTVHVGLAAKAGPDQGAFVDLAVSTPDGQECASGTAQTYEAQSVPLLWAGLRVTGPEPGADSDACAAADELVLSVAPREYGSWLADDLSGVPVELVVSEEPPVAPGNLPEPDNRPVWQEMAPSQEREIAQGGSSFNDAPLLEPGQSYDSDILVGEILFFRVPASFGQQVQAQLDSEPMTGALASYFGEHARVSAHLRVVSPERADVNAFLPGAEVDHGNLAQFGATETDRAIASSGPIRYLNRHAGVTGPRAATEGEYYVAVTADNPNLRASHAIPFVLTVDVVGEPDGAPAYVETPPGQTTDDAATTRARTDRTPETTTDEPAADEVGTDDRDPDEDDALAAGPTQDDGGMPWAWLLGGAGVVVAGAGAGLLATRRRGTTG